MHSTNSITYSCRSRYGINEISNQGINNDNNNNKLFREMAYVTVGGFKLGTVQIKE